MSSGQFGARSAKRDGSPKKQVRSETSLNLRCAARVVDTSHGIFHRRRISPRVRRTGTVCRKETVRNQRMPGIRMPEHSTTRIAAIVGLNRPCKTRRWRACQSTTVE